MIDNKHKNKIDQAFAYTIYIFGKVLQTRYYENDEIQYIIMYENEIYVANIHQDHILDVWNVPYEMVIELLIRAWKDLDEYENIPVIMLT